MKRRNVAVTAGIVAAIAIGVYIAIISTVQSSNIDGSNIDPASSNVSVASENISSLIFPRDSRPYGLSYEGWGREWWTYFVAIPEADSPAADLTGEKCSINQNNEYAWFLVGAFQGKVIRTCEVPADKALVASFIGIACNVRQDGPVDTLVECAEEGPRYLRLAKFTVDGIEVPNVIDYKVTTPPSNMTFPKGAVWGAPEGTYELAGSNILFVLEPLPPGNHTLTFQGNFDHPFNNVYDVAVDVMYNLIVK